MSDTKFYNRITITDRKIEAELRRLEEENKYPSKRALFETLIDFYMIDHENAKRPYFAYFQYETMMNVLAWCGESVSFTVEDEGDGRYLMVYFDKEKTGRPQEINWCVFLGEEDLIALKNKNNLSDKDFKFLKAINLVARQNAYCVAYFSVDERSTETNNNILAISDSFNNIAGRDIKGKGV